MSTSSTTLDAAPAPADTKPAGSRRAPVIMAVIGIAAALGGGSWYITHRGDESTDDAQVDADVVSVPTRAQGVVAKVLFNENQVVKAGDVLAELDAEPARARLAQADAVLEAARASAEAADADARVAETNARGNRSVAQASLEGANDSAGASKQQIAEGDALVTSATANRDKARSDLDRAKKLFESGTIAQAAMDQAQATYDTAAASLDQAKAHLAVVRASTSLAASKVKEASARLEQSSNVDALVEQARARARTAHAQVATAQAAKDLAALDLSYTKILAPQEGVVSKKAISVGQMVQPGQGVVSLVPTQALWVTGNFKETQLTHMRVGQPAHLKIDAFPGVTVHGEVESFSAATGARFSLLPPDNASGNFTKVVQRVPVRVHLRDLPPGVALRPGMSVDLVVDTTQ